MDQPEIELFTMENYSWADEIFLHSFVRIHSQKSFDEQQQRQHIGFWLVLFAFAVIACYLSDGFPHSKCVWNSAECLCVVLKNVWLCRGYYLSYGKRTEWESKLRSKTRVKRSRGISTKWILTDSIFRVEEREGVTGPEIG